MKDGWQVKRLGDLVDIQNGYAFNSKDYSETGHFVIRIGNVQNGCVMQSDPKFIDLSSNSPLQRFVLSEGDILVSLTGNVGRVGVIEKEHLPAVLNQRVARIKVGNGSPAIREFLLLFLYSDLFREELIGAGHGAAQQNVSTKDIVEIQLPVPPISEQQRIVGILDEAFEGIATAKANAEKNLQNARALFESHLQSVFAQRGEGWKQKTLEEIATVFGRGKSRHRPRNEPKLYGGEYPFIQTGDIRNSDHFITEYSQTYSEAGLAQSKLWPKGTICITIAANIAETGILDFDACFPDSVIGVVANPEEANVDYVEYLLQSFKVRIQAMGKGSAQANINMGTFENERFPFPAVSEQKQIVIKLNSLREETQRLESIYQQKLAALDALKKSLLDQAFTGQL
ncbi:MAG: restriction endonuclease subunit S [Desulfuromonadaceae bacterium]